MSPLMPRTLMPRDVEPATMNCPYCNTLMVDGNLALRGTGWGFLFFGWSYQHCWFIPEDGESEVVVSNKLGPRASHPGCSSNRVAHRCPACFTLIAPGEDVMIDNAVQQAAARGGTSPAAGQVAPDR